MSADEWFLTGAAAILGPVSWGLWVFQMLKIRALDRRAQPGIAILGVALLVCTAMILITLNTAASYDVVDAPVYQFMYVVLGLAWLRVAQGAFPFLGLSPRDDAVERGNVAAASACAGTLVAVTLCYAGANIGDGPGWWVVLFSSLLATVALFSAWGLLATLTPLVETVTVERDQAAGIRLGAFLISCGLIAGRGVAGNWESAAATVRDFFVVVPGIAVTVALAIVVERAANARATRPHAAIAGWGLLPAALYGLPALVTLALAGRPS